MQQLAFEMKLMKGYEIEYQKRHAEIWPELVDLLKVNGISEYQIYLNEESLSLFGVLKISDAIQLDELPQHPIMKKWWAYMKDIMETNSDNSPVSIPLKNVFILP
ncbi:MAG: L-rhamnose mutarotase [Sediminibacterium sp.]|jgi:L-rhamnose mutarotase|nr:L-rhamnose mutarotase [Sediminibacterium sp.]